MRREVLISIKGTYQPEGGSPDVIELITEGKYYSRKGSYYITYEESEATGMEGVTTTLKVDGQDSVTLIRNGSQRSRLLLEKGRRHLCHYETGYGPLLVGVSGCRIRSRLNDLGGELTFHYTLDVNSNTVSENEVYISVKEAKHSYAESYHLSN